MNSSTKNQLHTSIDIAKIVCAVFVVAIHTNFLRDIEPDLAFAIKNIIARVAVPFFFVSSGYFFTKKLLATQDNKTSVFVKYQLKLLLLYASWALIYFYFDSEHYLTGVDSLTTFCKFALLYLKDFIFVGINLHLWFVPALMLALSLLYIAYTKNQMPMFLALSFGLYVLGLLGSSYYGFVNDFEIVTHIFEGYGDIFVRTRNGLFFGFLFVMIGGVIAKRKLPVFKRFATLCVTLLSLIFLTCEVFFLATTQNSNEIRYDMTLMLIPLTYFLFEYVLATEINISDDVSRFIRKMSTGIYFVHVFFILVLRQWFGGYIFGSETLSFFVVLALSMAASYLMIKLKLKFLID